MAHPLAAAVGFLAALFVGTFVEYWGHRLMHVGKLLKVRHARHHARGWGQGWLGEFRDYFLPTLPILWLGFLHSPAAGWGFAVGDFMYAAVAAWAHQLQHEHPEAVFWMRQPVHAVHHYHREWHHNFGILVDVWDRAFGTYRLHETPMEWADRKVAFRKFWDIHWASVAPPLPKKPVRRRGEIQPG